MGRDDIGVGFTGAPHSARRVAELAQLAEKEGFSSVWCAEDYYLRDAISNISCVAYVTREVKISTGVINPFSRNPVLIAETIATLNELSGGRIRLALGTGVQPLIENMGIKFSHPLQAMAESVEIVRRLLTGEKLDYAGKIFSSKGVKLGENPYFSLLVSDLKVSPVPIYLAAIGPRMLELGGRIGDGVLFTAGFAVENVKWAVPLVRAGARKAGRVERDPVIGTYILAGLGEASRALKGFLAFDAAYARPENLVAAGIAERDVQNIRNTLKKKGMSEAADLVTPKIIDRFAACGTKGEIQAKVEEFRAAGVSEPVVLPMGTDAAELIHSLS